MKLKSLNVSLNQWGDNAGKYEISVEFEDQIGGNVHKDEIKLHIGEKFHKEFIKQCGVAIKKASDISAKSFFNNFDEAFKIETKEEK